MYAPSTVGTLLREFTFGHARQLESVVREHLVALCGRVELLPDAATVPVFIDIDSLLRPVYGHAKQGASCGHQDRRQADPAQGALTVSHHPQHRGVSTSDRRDAATCRQGRLGQGCRSDGRPCHRYRPRRRSRRADPRARRLGLRQPVGGADVLARGRPLFAGDDSQPHRRTRTGRHRGQRVDPGVLCRCRPRPRHRRLDL